MAKLKITLTKSPIGYAETQRKTVRSLGLRKMNSTVELVDNACTRGQVHKIRHLVTVEEIAD